MDAVAVDPIAALMAAPEEGRYEWVRGSLIEMAPPPSPDHARKILFLAEILDAYAEHHGLGTVFPDGLALRLDDSARVPDVVFVGTEKHERVRSTHFEGAPDLVIEIVSPESGARDRGEKFDDYEQAGIGEYWIVDPRRRIADFYCLVDGLYTPVLPDLEGRIYSSVLPGFFIKVAWLWDRPKLIDALRELGLI